VLRIVQALIESAWKLPVFRQSPPGGRSNATRVLWAVSILALSEPTHSTHTPVRAVPDTT